MTDIKYMFRVATYGSSLLNQRQILDDDKRLHCDYQELWLNSQSGHFSCGPQGPYYRSGQVSANLVEDLRSTAEMLQIDTCVEFLSKSSLNLDGDVVDFASWLCWGNDICINDLFGIEHHCGRPCVQADGVVINWDRKGEGCCRRLVPKGYIHNEVFDFLDNLRFGSIYLGRQRCEIARKAQVHLYYFDELHEFPALVDRTLIEGGMTRFLFDFDASGSPLVGTLRVSHSPNFVVNGRTWLPQAHHHFTCDDDIESCCMSAPLYRSSITNPTTVVLLNFFVLIHGFYPRPTSSPRSKPDNREDGSCGTAAKPTVYFFVRPLPVQLSEVKDWLNSEPIFWSFDENGITRIPESTREELGLPDMTLGDPQVTLRAWPKHHYDAIHKWQITRGFDPSTPDFARSLGIPIFKRVRPEKRQFKEVAKEKECEAPSPERDELDESFLSRLSKLSWWQAAADIPVGLM
ncbi:hypothetical protein VNI00_000454 [Paramarasmius palmivorus]|uniref:Uncharacterized protein n=1 Tax=Paramarasmius palmivorus TaxID=297713 RepID=A0AAW0E6B9_9AGAR